MKLIFKILLVLEALFFVVFFTYLNNTKLVNPKTTTYYNELKKVLKQTGYSNNLIIISTKRFKWHNELQVVFNGAASKSRHLSGDAIDFVVLDINKDGNYDSKDVDLVYNLLDKQIIKDKGGIGTYKNASNFFNKQMIHIDCRGYRARWDK
jgi:uncharacterized protein YcbK (DUF882 family)